jgi:hypothetical protein
LLWGLPRGLPRGFVSFSSPLHMCSYVTAFVIGTALRDVALPVLHQGRVHAPVENLHVLKAGFAQSA